LRHLTVIALGFQCLFGYSTDPSAFHAVRRSVRFPWATLSVNANVALSISLTHKVDTLHTFCKVEEYAQTLLFRLPTFAWKNRSIYANPHLFRMMCTKPMNYRIILVELAVFLPSDTPLLLSSGRV